MELLGSFQRFKKKRRKKKKHTQRKRISLIHRVSFGSNRYPFIFWKNYKTILSLLYAGFWNKNWRRKKYTWHMMQGVGWTFSLNFIILALTAWDLWCCEYLEEKDDSRNICTIKSFLIVNLKWKITLNFRPYIDFC